MTVDIDLVLTPVPVAPGVIASHAEFVDWARRNALDGRIVDFLADREDGAGATPREWMHMSEALKNADYQALRPDQKRQIAVLTIGQKAFDAYTAWAAERPED